MRQGNPLLKRGSFLLVYSYLKDLKLGLKSSHHRSALWDFNSNRGLGIMMRIPRGSGNSEVRGDTIVLDSGIKFGFYFGFSLGRHPITQQPACGVIRDVHSIALIAAEDFNLGGRFRDKEGDVAGAGSAFEDGEVAFGGRGSGAAPAKPGAGPCGIPFGCKVM